MEQLDPHDCPNVPEERMRLARELKDKASAALSRGEPIVATLHASDAVMLFPNERELLDVFDEVVLSTQDPLSLLPVATGAIHVATAAGRARVLMMQNRLPEALELLCAAVRVAPDIAYLDWVRRWFVVPHVLQTLPWDVLLESAVKTAIEVTVDVPVPPHPDDPRMPNVSAAAEYLANVRRHHGDQVLVYIAETMARRRLGDHAGATLAVAEEAAGRFPEDWNVRCALANALGDAGRIDEALAQARHALSLRPDDLSPLHDAAQGFVRAGRHAEAAPLFEEIVSREPQYPGAAASLHHVRWIAYQSPDDRNALLVMRDRQWWDGRVRDLADEIDPPQPFMTVLPGPGDATASAARHLLGEVEQIVRCCGVNAHLSLGLSARFPESPSVSVAFDAGLRALGARGAITVEAEELPSPDPRVEKTGLAYRVWTYDGMTPQRVYGQGDQWAQQAIANIAGQLFRQDVWDVAARELAAQLPPDYVHGLMSVLTEPVPPPDGFDGIFWTYRCQIATAVVLSHMGPWPHEPARSALQALLYGPNDWVTSAAIVALAWRARTDPGARPEIEGMFQWMRSQIPEMGYTPWEYPLAECWLGLGGHPDSVTQDLNAWLERYFATLPRKNQVRRPIRRYGGLTLEQYAQFCLERDRVIGGMGYQGPGVALSAFGFGNVPPELPEICQRYGVPLQHPETGGFYPFITEWQEALNADGDLHQEFLEIQRSIELERQGVSRQEKGALDNIIDGNMDMHLRMAQAQNAQRVVAEGDGDPDPVVFPGQPVARLSDYVGILKGMQSGDMMGALGRYGLDMMSYASIATAWGAKMAADPVLTEKFTRMMQS